MDCSERGTATAAHHGIRSCTSGSATQGGLGERTAEVSTCFAPETTHLLNLSYEYAPKADRDQLWEALDRARHLQSRPEADDL